MSSNLIWEPVPAYKGSFDSALKFALRSKYGEPVARNFTESDLEFLEGLRIGGVTTDYLLTIEAAKLMNLIERHHVVYVYEAF